MTGYVWEGKPVSKKQMQIISGVPGTGRRQEIREWIDRRGAWMDRRGAKEAHRQGQLEPHLSHFNSLQAEVHGKKKKGGNTITGLTVW